MEGDTTREHAFYTPLPTSASQTIICKVLPGKLPLPYGNAISHQEIQSDRDLGACITCLVYLLVVGLPIPANLAISLIRKGTPVRALSPHDCKAKVCVDDVQVYAHGTPHGAETHFNRFLLLAFSTSVQAQHPMVQPMSVRIRRRPANKSTGEQ